MLKLKKISQFFCIFCCLGLFPHIFGQVKAYIISLKDCCIYLSGKLFLICFAILLGMEECSSLGEMVSFK